MTSVDLSTVYCANNCHYDGTKIVESSGSHLAALMILPAPDLRAGGTASVTITGTFNSDNFSLFSALSADLAGANNSFEYSLHDVSGVSGGPNIAQTITINIEAGVEQYDAAVAAGETKIALNPSNLWTEITAISYTVSATDPGPCGEWVVHDLSAAISDSTLFSFSGSQVAYAGGNLHATVLGGGGQWQFAIPSIYLPDTGTYDIEITLGAPIDHGTGLGSSDIFTLGSVTTSVEVTITDDDHILGQTHTADDGNTVQTYSLPEPNDWDGSGWTYNDFYVTDVGKGYHSVLFKFFGLSTHITQIRTRNNCVPAEAPIPLNSIVRVEGTVDPLVAGHVAPQSLPYVLTVSKAYLDDGWPVWAYRYTHPMDPLFTGTLGDISGSALIYNGNPQAFLVPPGEFDLGSLGTIHGLVTGYFGVFDDFAVFSTASDPNLNGWIDPNSPSTVSAPAGDITTAWAQATAKVFPPANARFVVPQVIVNALAPSKALYLDAFDMRVVPASEDATVQPVYAPPRSLTVSVQPTRLNYASGSLTVRSLTPGETYTASAEVAGVREGYQFTATSSTEVLSFSGTASRILVERGTVAGEYFDGASGGADYMWEQGGTPGNARSYYYQDREARNYILTRMLWENVPIGMKVSEPVYGSSAVIAPLPFGFGAYGDGPYGG